MKYEQTINNLTNSLIGKQNQENATLFLNSIKRLKNDFGKRISVKFLMGLMSNLSNKKKSDRISYLLNKNDLKKKKVINFNIRNWGFNKFDFEVIEYKRDKLGKPFIKDIKLCHGGNLTYDNKNEVLHMIEF